MLVYSIFSHSEPNHLLRLVNALNDSDVVFFIHVDKKINLDEFSILKAYENVHFIKNRVKVAWAGYSLSQAYINTINEILATDIDFDYCFFLSGVDYPLVNPAVIKDYLKTPPHRQLIKGAMIENNNNRHYKKLTSWCFRDYFGRSFFEKAFRLTLEKVTSLLLPKNIEFRPTSEPLPQKEKSASIRKNFTLNKKIYMGSCWFALTKDCIQEIVKQIEHDQELITLLKYSYAPEECLFHTIIYNSIYKDQAAPALEFNKVTFDIPQTAVTHHIHESLKKIFTIDDYDELVNAGRLFSRKFATPYSSTLLDKLDTTIVKPNQESLSSL